MKFVFLSNLHYFYAQTDGTYKFPNSAEGDLLKQAKKEIETLEKENASLKRYVEYVERYADEDVVKSARKEAQS